MKPPGLRLCHVRLLGKVFINSATDNGAIIHTQSAEWLVNGVSDNKESGLRLIYRFTSAFVTFVQLQQFRSLFDTKKLNLD